MYTDYMAREPTEAPEERAQVEVEVEVRWSRTLNTPKYIGWPTAQTAGAHLFESGSGEMGPQTDHGE